MFTGGLAANRRPCRSIQAACTQPLASFANTQDQLSINAFRVVAHYATTRIAMRCPDSIFTGLKPEI